MRRNKFNSLELKELMLYIAFILLNVACVATWATMIWYLTSVGQSPVFSAFGSLAAIINLLSGIFILWK